MAMRSCRECGQKVSSEAKVNRHGFNRHLRVI